METLLQSRSFFSLNQTRFHNYNCRREKNSMNCPPIICSHLYYRGVPMYRVGRRWSFLVMCSFQISSRDILPCLCTAVWIMNDCDWGPHWGKAAEQSRFSHFNIWLPLCSWSSLSTVISAPLQKTGRETPPITALKCTQVCLTGSEEQLVHFPWIVEVLASESEKHHYSLGFKNELSKNPPSFHQLNAFKTQTKAKISFFSEDISN